MDSVIFIQFNNSILQTSYKFTAQVEKDKETGLYVSVVPDLPGDHT
jgi:hypothetical protein